MTNGETMRELVRRWNEVASMCANRPTSTPETRAQATGWKQCADELEAALAATVQAEVGAGVLREGDEVWVQGEVNVLQEGDTDWIEVVFNDTATGTQFVSVHPAALAAQPSVQAEVGAGEPCIHVNLIKQVGTMDGGVESTRYRCKGCSLFFVIKPHEITVEYGSARPDVALREAVTAELYKRHPQLGARAIDEFAYFVARVAREVVDSRATMEAQSDE